MNIIDKEMNIQDRAMMVAEKAHQNQSYGIYPYMYHIKSVVEVAKYFGYNDDIVVGCVLHDVLEDSDLSYNDIKKEFGEKIAEIVYAVTDELGRNRKERKEKTYPKIRLSEEATLVKLCDRISNIQHSKRVGSSMFKKYKQEHAEFKKQLVDDFDSNEVTTLCNYLESELDLSYDCKSIPVPNYPTYKIEKLSDDRFKGIHPNCIDEGYFQKQQFTHKPNDPEIGHRYRFGSLTTSVVTEILEDGKFKTLNSTYQVSLCQ